MSSSEKIEITLIDEVRGKSFRVRVPLDKTVDWLVRTAVQKLNLPRTSPDGSPATYQAVLKSTNEVLNPHLTLREAGVNSGDVIKLVQTIVPG